MLTNRLPGRYLPIALIGVAVFVGSVCAGEVSFVNWWSHFRSAVGSGDAATVAQGAKFPMPWENGPIREIRTRAELTTRFGSYFTAEIRKAVAGGKPERLPTGEYMLTWKARGNEYSMYFTADGNGGFRLNGLSEGPA